MLLQLQTNRLVVLLSAPGASVPLRVFLPDCKAAILPSCTMLPCDSSLRCRQLVPQPTALHIRQPETGPTRTGAYRDY